METRKSKEECVCQDPKRKTRERDKTKMSSVKQQEQSSLDQTQQRESETPQVKPSTTDRVVDSEYIHEASHLFFFT